MDANERFKVASNPRSFPNWGYKTTPQQQLSGQEVDCSRGKGLGGTTAINYCGWVVGPRDDYDEWAMLVGDDSFKWSNVKRLLDRISRLHPEIPDPDLRKYLDPRVGDHGTAGVIDLSYGRAWVKATRNIFVAAEQTGIRTNKDINAGDPIGLGMGTVTCYQGKRVTAVSAYLSTTPSNLTIVTGALASKLVLEGKMVKGVETVDGRAFSAVSEVIVCAGALNSPQLLLLSGIGPGDELKKHGIPVLHELPAVGKNLQDHCFSTVGVVVKHSPEFEEEQTPLSPSPMAFLKSASALTSPEYHQLPWQVHRHLQAPTVPNFEMALRHSHTPPTFLDYPARSEVSFIASICILDNPQSSGTVTLRSSDPNDPPIIDPNYLTHAFDRRVIIDAVRQTMQLLTAPVYAGRILEVLGPKDDSDEMIWEHVRRRLGSSWHMCCTIRMGRDQDSACVDANFRVFGLEKLRVVDLSVCPFVPNNHTQSTAYVLGEMAADKLINEYILDERLSSL